MSIDNVSQAGITLVQHGFSIGHPKIVTYWVTNFLYSPKLLDVMFCQCFDVLIKTAFWHGQKV